MAKKGLLSSDLSSDFISGETLFSVAMVVGEWWGEVEKRNVWLGIKLKTG